MTCIRAGLWGKVGAGQGVAHLDMLKDVDMDVDILVVYWARPRMAYTWLRTPGGGGRGWHEDVDWGGVG